MAGRDTEKRATTTSGGTIAVYSYAAASSCRGDVFTSTTVNQLQSDSPSSSSSWQTASLMPPASPKSSPHILQEKPHYVLRSHEPNIPVLAESAPSKSALERRLSIFHPYITEPLPDHSVARKILGPLRGRDYKTGMLYIFFRDLSLGHVKIGWSAESVQNRLNYYSRCGYEPRLLFEVASVPHAQRVELLTHYELVKEWRSEAYCEVHDSRHCEWFETSKTRAVQILGSWADFMKRAKPYDTKGLLKTGWREIVECMERNRELVTAARLLQHYEQSLNEDRVLPAKTGEVESCSYVPKTGLRDEAQMLNMQPPPEQIHAGIGYLAKSKNEQQEKSRLQIKPLPEREFAWNLDSQTNTTSPFGESVPDYIKPSSMLGTRNSKDKLLAKELSNLRQLGKAQYAVKVVEKKRALLLLIPGLWATRVNIKLLPEHIPFFLSPLFPCTVCPQGTLLGARTNILARPILEQQAADSSTNRVYPNMDEQEAALMIPLSYQRSRSAKWESLNPANRFLACG